MLKKFEKYHVAQSWFAKNKEIYSSSRHHAFLTICAKIAEVMEVQRVGIWFYTRDKDAIYEEMTHVAGGENSQGTILLKQDYPKYFLHIGKEIVIAANNALKDSPVSEFVENYLKRINTRALLDSPIFSDGEMLGILCCEQLHETRDWDIHDKNFAACSADFIGRIIEAEKRHTYEKELRHRINYLENGLKRKLDDLNDAKLSLDLALESAQVGKWDWEFETNKITLNTTWFTKLGYQYNELPQEFSTFKMVLHPDDIDRVIKELDRHRKGKTNFYECRYRMLTKTGEIQWCLDRGCTIYRKTDGTPVRMTGVNVNVTPIVKWEQGLRLSEQQLKAMIQSLPNPVVMFDKDLMVLAFSSMWKEEWHFFANIKEGDTAESIFPIDWVENMKLALNGQRISNDDELMELRPGMSYWLRWVIQPWKNSNQEIGGVVMMVKNITTKKETEIRLAQASKLSALGEMAGGIAHEINNPLSIIKGYVDLLRRHSSRHTLGQDLLLQYIQKMDITVGRISKIVSGMRRFSRDSSTDEKVRYSLNKIVEETLDICQEKINNNGTAVVVQYLKGAQFVFCRPVEISQVLLNLINNSYQATFSYTHPWIKIKMEEFTDFFRISVIDNGESITPSIRQKLFQPFFTTKEVGVGTGLGLSISRGIVEEHRGKLYYQDDEPNTTFVIELPKMPQEEAQITH